MIKNLKNYLTIIFFAYVFSYFSVFMLFTNPGTGFSDNPFLLFIYFIVYVFILKYILKVFPNLNKPPLLYSLFLSSIFGFLSALALNIYTINKVNQILKVPFESSDFIFKFNTNSIIWIYILMIFISVVAYLIHLNLHKEANKKNVMDLKFIVAIYFIFAFVNILTFGTYVIITLWGL